MDVFDFSQVGRIVDILFGMFLMYGILLGIKIMKEDKDNDNGNNNEFTFITLPEDWNGKED